MNQVHPFSWFHATPQARVGIVDTMVTGRWIRSITLYPKGSAMTLRTVFRAPHAEQIPRPIAPGSLVAGPIGFGGWPAASWLRFGSDIRQILVTRDPLTNDGHVLDVLPTVNHPRATMMEAVTWAHLRGLGGAHPTLLLEVAELPAFRAAFANAGARQPNYWVRHITGVPEIPVGAIACEYADPAITGQPYSLTAAAAYWPGVDPVSLDNTHITVSSRKATMTDQRPTGQDVTLNYVASQVDHLADSLTSLIATVHGLSEELKAQNARTQRLTARLATLSDDMRSNFDDVHNRAMLRFEHADVMLHLIAKAVDVPHIYNNPETSHHGLPDQPNQPLRDHANCGPGTPIGNAVAAITDEFLPTTPATQVRITDHGTEFVDPDGTVTPEPEPADVADVASQTDTPATDSDE